MATTGSTTPIATEARRGPGCLVQILWFLFIGWWLGGILIAIAWLLNVSIIGLPLGIAILNNIPKVVALQEPSIIGLPLGIAILNNIPKVVALQEPTILLQTVERHGRTVIVESDLPQLNFWLRAIYFVLVGWWWSGLWLALAYALCATFILMPVGLSMFRMTPAMTTLRRY